MLQMLGRQDDDEITSFRIRWFWIERNRIFIRDPTVRFLLKKLNENALSLNHWDNSKCYPFENLV